MKLSYIMLEIVAKRLRALFKTKWDEKLNDGNTEDQLNEKLRESFKKSKDYREKIETGDVQQWDITTLCKIFLYSNLNLIEKNSSQYKEIDKIRDYRNKWFAHAEDMSCSNNDFTDRVEEIKRVAKNLFQDDTHRDISDISEKPVVDEKMIEDLVEPLKLELSKDVAKVVEKQLNGNYLHRFNGIISWSRPL